MKKIISYFLIWAYFISGNIAQEAGDHLFNNSFLHQIHFEASGLEQIIPYSPGYYNDPVKMTIDGQVVESVFIRRKGFTSNEFNDTNPPFKIDIDFFIEGQGYDGIDKFNLHNHHLDDSFQRNALAYSLYRRAGVAAPRTAFAEVYINGAFIALYTITEDVEKTFLKQNFASNDGSLYKGVEFPVNGVTVQEGTIDAYDYFINNANPNNLATIVDIHNYFRVLGVDLIIKDWDTYARGSHNFYMYHEPESEKLHLITWDHNFAFSFLPDLDNSLYPIRILEKEITTSQAMKPVYLQSLCDLLSYLLDENYIKDLAGHNHQILSSNTHQVVVPAPDGIIELIASQKQWFREKLAEEGYHYCDGLTLPLNSGEVIINEFVAKNNAAGILEPNGETGDWIELYNNSSSDILLDQKYYLSDDRDFPKKWHFEETVTIPAKGYLIVWADRDIDQEGIHTNFKLDGSGGDLLFTYEDLTGLQQVNYGVQVSNMGYARVPNGTGDFQIQTATFKASNDQALPVKNQVEQKEITLYPNPTSGAIYLQNIDPNKDWWATVTDLLGQKLMTTRATPELDVSHLTDGYYFLFLRDGLDCAYFKFLLKTKPH